MSFVHVDHPDEVIHWFKVYPETEQQRRPIGDCPHACPHMQTAVIGWGPDLQHYELIICTDSGCRGNCRGWVGAPVTYDQLCAVDWKVLDGTP
jgi:hypothetical protein